MNNNTTNIFKKVSDVLLFCTGFSIAFNTLEMSDMPISYVLLFTVLYSITIIPSFSIAEIRKEYGKGVFGFLYFFIFLTIVNLISVYFYANNNKVPIVNPSILLNVIFFYSVLIHSIRNKLAPQIALYGFTIGAVLLSVYFIEGSRVEVDIKSGRLTIFGLNPNDLGIYMSLASIVVYSDLILQDRLHIKMGRFLFIFPIIIMISVMFATGSRTAFLIFVLSFVCSIFIFKTKRRRIRYLYLFISISMAVIGYYAIINSDYVVVERLLDDSGDDRTSGRTQIWNALFPYIISNPVWGYGEIGYNEISSRAFANIQGHNYGAGYSPHNVLIEVSAYTGIIGLFFMLIFWLTIFKNAYKQYKVQNRITTFLLLVPLLFALVSGQALVPRHYYLIYLVAIVPTIKIKIKS